MTSEITITRPDDWHLHVRDGAALQTVVPHTAAQFARAIIMPNLKPPVTTTAQALAYRERILAAVPRGVAFEPLMTLYLTDKLPPDEIRRAKEAGITAVKLYPAGATTNSDAGVTDLRHCHETLDMMQREGLPLLVHGEVTDGDIDLFDREAVFIDRTVGRGDEDRGIVRQHLRRPGQQGVGLTLGHRAAITDVEHEGLDVALQLTPASLRLKKRPLAVFTSRSRTRAPGRNLSVGVAWPFTSLTKATVVGRSERARYWVSTFEAVSVSARISPSMSFETPEKKAEGAPRRPSAMAVLKTAPPA